MASGLEINVPKHASEKIEELFPDGFPRSRLDNSPNFDPKEQKKYCEKLARLTSFAVPYDARFPQQRIQNKCFRYYVDFYRCKELMGDEYKPCKFFSNVFTSICHQQTVEKWDELREEGKFPYRFDR